MYSFKTTKENIQTLLVDGYQIGDLILENIFIGIKFNNKGNIYAFITDSDKEKLQGIDYEYLIIEAQIKALDAINNKDFAFFYNSPKVIDIIDLKGNSYYQKPHKHNHFFINKFKIFQSTSIFSYQ